MQKTSKSITAGILGIIAGSLCAVLSPFGCLAGGMGGNDAVVLLSMILALFGIIVIVSSYFVMIRKIRIKPRIFKIKAK